MDTNDVAILRALHAAAAQGRYLSRRELVEAGAPAQGAALSRSLAGLSGAGFEVESHPHFGYRLRATPPRLVAADVVARYAGPVVVGREVHVYAETGSSNDVVARAGLHGAPEGLAVFAETQRAARGQHGRPWSAAPGLGLWFSVLLRPTAVPVSRWSLLALWAALAVADTLEEAVRAARAGDGAEPAVAGSGRGVAPGGPEVQIKWPNDVLLAGRKASGILIEASPANGFVVAGIGVNVHHRSADFPPELRATATSLAQAVHAAPDRTALAARLLETLDRRYAQWCRDPAAIVAACQPRNALRGRTVRLRPPGIAVLPGTPEATLPTPAPSSEEAVVEGFSPEGHLQLRRLDPAGTRLTVTGRHELVL